MLYMHPPYHCCLVENTRSAENKRSILWLVCHAHANDSIWHMLQSYLKSLEATTMVVVSHDRAFLDAVATEIIVFRHMRLAYHAGNYSGTAHSLMHASNSILPCL